MEKNLEVIILAAGRGTRMRSSLPKVLHTLAGKPLLQHVIDTARALDPSQIHVVVGHGADSVQKTLSQQELKFHSQKEQLGTGHAVGCALPACQRDSVVLVLFGDVPLITASTLQALIGGAQRKPMMLAARLENPRGYGRVLRDEAGGFLAVVEQADASESEALICEVNTGVLAAPADQLASLLKSVSNDNAQEEYYLPDVLGLARQQGIAVEVVVTKDALEMYGVNDLVQLQELERLMQCKRADALMASGVAVADRQRIDIRGELECGVDVVIDINVVFEGQVRLGDGVRVGAHCVLKDVDVSSGTDIQPFCHLEGAVIGEQCRIGPYARLRPGSVLADTARVGNFVETKNTTFGVGSKANHLAYIGDTTVGPDTNIGAGTITCNYDGIDKHKTSIGNGVFVGSNSTLVAPVTLSDGAFVAAGSVVTNDVAGEELAVGRARQRNIAGWQRPNKKKD
jgi:bifunctional UDP-N-acetylglucosamine pyrophosphorylase/glucosamine-1-phosphate N-acetyltransferase